MKNILRQWRTEHGLTQIQLANLIGIGYQQYQRYEYETDIPNLELAFKISNVLNLKVDNIWYVS